MITEPGGLWVFDGLAVVRLFYLALFGLAGLAATRTLHGGRYTARFCLSPCSTLAPLSLIDGGGASISPW